MNKQNTYTYVSYRQALGSPKKKLMNAFDSMANDDAVLGPVKRFARDAARTVMMTTHSIHGAKHFHLLSILHIKVEFFGRTVSIYASFKATQVREAAMRLAPAGCSEEQVALLWHNQHTYAGERMHELCLDLRGFYMKVRYAPWSVDRLASNR